MPSGISDNFQNNAGKTTEPLQETANCERTRDVHSNFEDLAIPAEPHTSEELNTAAKNSNDVKHVEKMKHLLNC